MQCRLINRRRNNTENRGATKKVEPMNRRNVREKQNPGTKLLLTGVGYDADVVVVEQILVDRVPVKLDKMLKNLLRV